MIAGYVTFGIISLFWVAALSGWNPFGGLPPRDDDEGGVPPTDPFSRPGGDSAAIGLDRLRVEPSHPTPRRQRVPAEYN